MYCCHHFLSALLYVFQIENSLPIPVVALNWKLNKRKKKLYKMPAELQLQFCCYLKAVKQLAKYFLNQGNTLLVLSLWRLMTLAYCIKFLLLDLLVYHLEKNQDTHYCFMNLKIFLSYMHHLLEYYIAFPIHKKSEAFNFHQQHLHFL